MHTTPEPCHHPDQPFQVASSSCAEERCGKSEHNSPHPEHNQLREGGVTRERKNQRSGGAASSNRSRNGVYNVKVGSSPTVHGRLESSKKELRIEMTQMRKPRLTGRVKEASLEMRFEMSQQRELTTGARGSDARSCHDSARRTPPIPLTGRSAKRGIHRVVPADHKARARQHATQPRGDWPCKPSDLCGRLRPRNTLEVNDVQTSA